VRALRYAFLEATPESLDVSSDRLIEMPAPDSLPPLSEQERNAMRSYIQRAEVRLSTMHRVAVGFISGAGLLFLFPVFFKDAILLIIRELLNYQPPAPPIAGTGGIAVIVAMYLCVLYPLGLSLGIPAIALVVLIKDIVRFYFSGHTSGYPEDFFNPRFILSGVGFSPDESESVKNRVMAHQYGSDLINFVLPHDEKKSAYFSDLLDPELRIVPKSRKITRLVERGVVSLPNVKSVTALGPDDVVCIEGNGDAARISHPERRVKEIDRFNAALGLAGFLDRPLHEEVAKSEVSLVRHSLNLRRLVLRYAQALLIFVWTMTVSFAMLPFVQDTHHRFPTLTVYAVGYTIWSMVMPFVVQLPIYWLVRLSDEKIRRSAVEDLQRRDSVESFEKQVKLACFISLATSLAAVGLSLWLHLN
jgi:hypothetical protein